MKRACLFLLMVADWTASAAQIKLSWTNSGAPVTVLTSTDVTFTIAALTETTNRVRKQYYSVQHGNLIGNLVLKSWSVYFSSLEENTLVTENMITNWSVLTTTTNSSFVMNVDSAKRRFFAVTLNDTDSVSLGWDKSPSPNVDHYTLRYGGSSGVYTNSVRTGGATDQAGIDGLIEGKTYYFSVVAVNSSGQESLPSNELVYTMKRTGSLLPLKISR